MHLADLKSHLEAGQRLTALYADAWARKAILNGAGCGKFSSDHGRPIRRRNLASGAVSGEKDWCMSIFAAGRQAGAQGDAGRSGPPRTRIFRTLVRSP